jgi:hypothetical protein
MQRDEKYADTGENAVPLQAEPYRLAYLIAA